MKTAAASTPKVERGQSAHECPRILYDALDELLLAAWGAHNAGEMPARYARALRAALHKAHVGLALADGKDLSAANEQADRAFALAALAEESGGRP